MNKHIEPIGLMYYTKKAILLYERVFGYKPIVDPCDIATLESIETQERFETVCARIQETLKEQVFNANLSNEDKEFLEELQFSNFLELADEGDFALVTEKYYHRKFFNEIPNDAIITSLITAFERLWGLPSEGPYFIEIYDLGDEAIFFESYDAMKQFVDDYDATPYTAFEIKEHCSIELYSE